MGVSYCRHVSASRSVSQSIPWVFLLICLSPLSHIYVYLPIPSLALWMSFAAAGSYAFLCICLHLSVLTLSSLILYLTVYCLLHGVCLSYSGIAPFHQATLLFLYVHICFFVSLSMCLPISHCFSHGPSTLHPFVCTFFVFDLFLSSSQNLLFVFLFVSTCDSFGVCVYASKSFLCLFCNKSLCGPPSCVCMCVCKLMHARECV